MANKWLNLILLGGLLCSGTVGTMYGYSYAKDNIKIYLKETGLMSKEDAIDLASNAYDVGFAGQYAAFVPGMIFDAFGPVVTILTGAGLIGAGYNMLAAGVVGGTSWLVYLGICMAGMGSKSLGMGAMLGSLSLVDESKVSTLSGIYLGLDASSAIFAVFAFTTLFVKEISADMKTDEVSTLYKLNDKFVEKAAESKSKKLELLGDYFGWLGIVIAIIGCCVASVYFVGMKKVQQAKEEEKQAKSEEEEALLANGEEVKVAVKGEDVAKTKKSAPKKVVEKKTLWSGVVCVYIICMFGECTGLFFNKLTGEHAQSSLEYNHVLSIKTIFNDDKHKAKLTEDNKHTVFPDSDPKNHGKHQFIVTTHFLNNMGMQAEETKKISLIDISKVDDKYVVTVERPGQASKSVDFNEKMAEEKAIYFTKEHKEHGGAIEEDIDAFKATWSTKWNVFFLFTMGNAVGRLSFGIASDILAGYKILALTKSFYIMVCCVLYIIFFGFFAMIPDLSAAPMQVNILTALIGITYGGIFTMVTAYMKEVCAKNQVGMLLGFALVILAVMTYCGNNFLYKKYIVTKYDEDVQFHSWGIKTDKNPHGEEDKYKTDAPSMAGKNTLKSFCIMSIIGNVIALVVSIFMWLQHMQIKKAEIAAAEEAEFTDESDDENEADHK